jgi:hypothetical protein
LLGNHLMYIICEEKHCFVAWQPPDVHYLWGETPFRCLATTWCTLSVSRNTVSLLGNHLMYIICEEKHCFVVWQPPDAHYLWTEALFCSLTTIYFIMSSLKRTKILTVWNFFTYEERYKITPLSHINIIKIKKILLSMCGVKIMW